jgi:hypothetical protein
LRGIFEQHGDRDAWLDSLASTTSTSRLALVPRGESNLRDTFYRSSMNADVFQYGDDGFPNRARLLISNKQTFSFELTGEACRQLLPHVENGRIADPAKLGLKPKLQALLAILMFAEGQEQAVSLEVETERVRFYVGVGKA